MEAFEKAEKTKLKAKERKEEDTRNASAASPANGNLTGNGSSSSVGANSSSSVAPGNKFRVQLQQRRGETDKKREERRLQVPGFRQGRVPLLRV